MKRTAVVALIVGIAGTPAAIARPDAVAQSRPVPDVPGAAALLESRETPGVVVRFTNLTDVGLESLDLEVKTGSEVLKKSWSVKASALGTGGVGEVQIATQASASAVTVRVVLAIFADGTMDGDPDEVTRVRAVQAALSEDLFVLYLLP